MYFGTGFCPRWRCGGESRRTPVPLSGGGCPHLRGPEPDRGRSASASTQTPTRLLPPRRDGGENGERQGREIWGFGMKTGRSLANYSCRRNRL